MADYTSNGLRKVDVSRGEVQCRARHRWSNADSVTACVCLDGHKGKHENAYGDVWSSGDSCHEWWLGIEP